MEEKPTKSKEEYKSMKECIEKLCKDWGLPAESAVIATKNMLKIIGASREAYHRSDYNGTSCHQITANAHEIAAPLKCVLYDKMKDDCMKEMTDETVDDDAATFELIDVAMSSLCLLFTHLIKKT